MVSCLLWILYTSWKHLAELTQKALLALHRNRSETDNSGSIKRKQSFEFLWNRKTKTKLVTFIFFCFCFCFCTKVQAWTSSSLPPPLVMWWCSCHDNKHVETAAISLLSLQPTHTHTKKKHSNTHPPAMYNSYLSAIALTLQRGQTAEVSVSWWVSAAEGRG